MTDAPDTPATVLIVEDEALVAMLVEDTLAEAGYRPVRSPDGRAAPPSSGRGAEARAAVVGLRCAAGLDGRQVVRRLREQDPSMPVLVVTGFDPRAPEADLRGLGGPIVRLVGGPPTPGSRRGSGRPLRIGTRPAPWAGGRAGFPAVSSRVRRAKFRGVRMRRVRLDHVQLAMPDGGEADARPFHADALGPREVPRPPDLARRGGRCFEGKGTAHASASAPIGTSGPPTRRTRPSSGPVTRDVQ
jgi:CheY-like chemotaxis protein